jgi:hypothetical protein
MARIRSVKPEFWEDEKVGNLSPLARLLFLGSWNLADDEGVLRWTADYLNASLFMYDGLTVARVSKLMREVVSAGLIFPYLGGVGHQQLAYVINFRRHQRINRPQPGKFAPPSVQSRDVQRMYGERDGWQCHLCRGPIPQGPAGDLTLSLDHLVPRSHGGGDEPSNIAAAHVGCNKARGDRPITDFVLPHSVSQALNRSVSDSVNAHGTFTPSRAPAEQGAGSREQGAGSSADAGGSPPPPLRAVPPPDTAATVVAAYADAVKAAGALNDPRAKGRLAKDARALLVAGAPVDLLVEAAKRLAVNGYADLGNEARRLWAERNASRGDEKNPHTEWARSTR